MYKFGKKFLFKGCAALLQACIPYLDNAKQAGSVQPKFPNANRVAYLLNARVDTQYLQELQTELWCWHIAANQVTLERVHNVCRCV